MIIAVVFVGAFRFILELIPTYLVLEMEVIKRERTGSMLFCATATGNPMLQCHLPCYDDIYYEVTNQYIVPSITSITK